MYSKLEDRTLWYDGDVSYDPSIVLEAIRTHPVKFIDDMIPEIEIFNRTAPRDKRIKVKTELEPIDAQLIPDVQNITIEEIVGILNDRHSEILKANDYSEREIIRRDRRLSDELAIFASNKIYYNMLRSIIHVLNKLNETNTVWGVGRGSSVSSYLLYVLGIHDVDSYKFELDFDDFINSDFSDQQF